MLAALLVLAGCGRDAPPVPYQPMPAAAPAAAAVAEYKFGVVPMENFRHVHEVYQPIIDHLNAGLRHARLTLEVAHSLAAHEEKLRARRFAFALSNPYQTVVAVERDGYRVFGKMGDDESFRGIWLVRRDSGLRELAQLKGRKVCFPPRTALAATMMTQYQLHRHGLRLGRDVRGSYVGSQDAAIMEVYLKGADACATWPLAWTSFQRLHPDMAAELEVRWPTAPLVNQGLAARDDVPPDVVRQVAALMAAMHETEPGRAMLARLPVRRFEHAGDAHYEPVREFVKTYRKAFPAAVMP